MNRVETAIREGRCVLAIGQQALSNPDVLNELRNRSIPAVHLGGTAVDPVRALTAANLVAALGKPAVFWCWSSPMVLPMAAPCRSLGT